MQPLEERLARAAAHAVAPDMGAPDDYCCIPGCGAALIGSYEGTEGGVRRQRICPVHSTRGTQHLRARGMDTTYVPGHPYPGLAPTDTGGTA